MLSLNNNQILEATNLLKYKLLLRQIIDSMFCESNDNQIIEIKVIEFTLNNILDII
jgi:hypothetical protein